MLTHSLLQELIYYDAETGVFTWKHRDESLFASRRSYASFCGKYANKVAGYNKTAVNGKDYRNIMILNVNYLSHRVAWFYIYGNWPVNDIDHIDGNGMNNKIINLRDVTAIDNGRNKRLPENNNSGVVGVSWHKRDKVWEAKIKVNQKAIYLGRFSSIESAAKVRKSAEIKYKFHKNHGIIRPL